MESMLTTGIVRSASASIVFIIALLGLGGTTPTKAQNPFENHGNVFTKHNFLKNPGFDRANHGVSSQTTTGQGPGRSAAESWTTWLVHGTITTQLVKSTSAPASSPCPPFRKAPFAQVSTVMHVNVQGGGGIVQQWQKSDTGPKNVDSSVWVYVISGQVTMGTGNGGNTGGDAFSSKTGEWELLSAPNGISPANEFIVYGKTQKAEFCVEDARVVVAPRQGAARKILEQSIDGLFAKVGRTVPEFGGMFLGPDETLQVYLLDTRPEVVTAAQAAITEVFGRTRIPRGGVRVLKADYSFLQLLDMHDRGINLLSIPGVILKDIDERKNRLRIGIKDMDVQAKVAQQLAELGIPGEAVQFEMVSPNVLDTSLLDRTRPLVGSLAIGGCTLGFIAERQGVRGFVTNSHCTSASGLPDGMVTGSAFFDQPTSDPVNNNRIGVETIDAPLFSGLVDPNNPEAWNGCPGGRRCRFSDSAFVAIPPDVASSLGSFAKPDFDFLNFSATSPLEKEIWIPIAGERVFRFGKAGGVSEGEIHCTCVDINVAQRVVTPVGPVIVDSDITLLCQGTVEPPPGVPGDSGSPVYQLQHVEGTAHANRVHLYGIHWGGNPERSNFSPLLWIHTELGRLDVKPGGDPPRVRIIEPRDRATVKYGAFDKVRFEAEVVDPDETPECWDPTGSCTLTWRSDRDGIMGTGRVIEFGFTSSEARRITVTADSGQKSQDEITINMGNTAPQVWIEKPTHEQTVFRNFPVVLRGGSFDNELWNGLPCSSLKWTSGDRRDTGFPATGCAPQVSFIGTGFRTITLKGTDAEGESDTATVRIRVRSAPTNSPPMVTILSPTNLFLQPTIPVTLKGTAKDPDGKSPIAYKWILDQDGHKTTLGTATSENGKETSMQWKPSNNVQPSCGGGSVKIYLEATDVDGKVRTESIKAFIAFPPC